MSTKAKFVALLTITVMLMSFLIKSHSFSALHKKNPQPVDMFTTLVIVGVFAGLIMIVVLALYFRDIPGSKKHFECDDGFTLGHFIVSFLFGLIFSILFLGSSLPIPTLPRRPPTELSTALPSTG